MSWDRDSLWAKSRVYFERAFDTDREDHIFGLWCAMGLELLARAAVANVSPTLLAMPDKEQKFLLIALGHGSAKAPRRSIATNQVLALCKILIRDFNEEQLKLASALTGRRNEELHSGTAAFSEYTTQQWIAGFYKCCKILAESQGESLTNLFGDDEAKIAEKTITEFTEKIIQKIQSQIAAHKKVFYGKDETERERLRLDTKKQGEILAHKKHHCVECPACKCTATVQGDAYGQEQVEHAEDEIIVRQSIIPTKFVCPACELKLNGYGELLSANVANYFIHRAHYSPESFYEVVNPSNIMEMQSYIDEYHIESYISDHFCNE